MIVKPKVAMLLSGGVDSSVALALLKQQGYDVTAYYIKVWLEDELAYLGNCPWEEDVKYAEATCKKLNVPFQIVPMQKEYFSEIVRYVLHEVKRGRTPNPDMMCNQTIKFGLFAKKIGKEFSAIASGHYAQTARRNGKVLLQCSPDAKKDQTYFLASLKQNQLDHVLFPIGRFTKEEVRKLARKFDLPTKNRKDSQGICFLGKLKYRDFVRHHCGIKTGVIIEYETGKKLGTHEGFWHYTIGQRKGIGLSGGPYYVVKKSATKNQILVSKKYHEPEKKRNRFMVSDFQWISGTRPKKSRLAVKIRHGEKSYPCRIAWEKTDRATVKISGNDQGIAEGQFAVFYDGDLCLGTGVIRGDVRLF